MSVKTKSTTLKQVSPHVDVVGLTTRQATDLKAAEAKCVEVKCRISDITESIIIAERQRTGLFDELYKAQAEYVAKVNKLAQMNGIDTEANPAETGERWNFDPTASTFTRTAVDKG